MIDDLNYNQFELLPVSSIIVDDNQARKKFDNDALSELSNSIEKVGIINPITVTKDGDKYRVIAGERRLKAAIAVGMDSIPAILTEGSELRLKELQIIENCQRKDMNPIEELEAFMGLISAGYNPENVAQQIGKSIKYVLTRLNLVRLIDRAKKLLYSESINMAQCRYLVIMEKEMQDKALDELIYTDGLGNVQFLPAKNFHEYLIKNQTYEIASANFDPKDIELYKEAGSCIDCKSNSTHNSTLFDGISISSLCSNPKCFIKKTEYNIQKLIAKWESEGLEVIEASQYNSDVYPASFNYSRVSQEEINNKNFVVETVLIIVESNSETLGTYYPVYSKSQLKAINKASLSGSNDPKVSNDKKALKAINRYTDLVVSRISENFIQNENLYTPGIHLIAIYNMYTLLSQPLKQSFISSFVKDFEAPDKIDYKKIFFDNIKVIEENIEMAFAVINLMNLKSEFIYKDELEFTLIDKLANESSVDINGCKDDITKESGIDLTDI